MSQISEYLETEITPDEATPIAELACLSFRSSGPTLEKRVEKILTAHGSNDPEKVSGRRFVIWSGNQVVAHARTFVRIVTVADQQIPVLALASVCTHPDRRGQGLGVEITKKAFELVGRPGWPDVSLFQTPVAEFYKKLNSRIVTNNFVDSTNATAPDANPWRDDTVMIYPSDYDWPDGTVDLNGPDY